MVDHDHVGRRHVAHSRSRASSTARVTGPGGHGPATSQVATGRTPPIELVTNTSVGGRAGRSSATGPARASMPRPARMRSTAVAGDAGQDPAVERRGRHRRRRGRRRRCPGRSPAGGRPRRRGGGPTRSAGSVQACEQRRGPATCGRPTRRGAGVRRGARARAGVQRGRGVDATGLTRDERHPHPAGRARDAAAATPRAARAARSRRDVVHLADAGGQASQVWRRGPPAVPSCTSTVSKTPRRRARDDRLTGAGRSARAGRPSGWRRPGPPPAPRRGRAARRRCRRRGW